MVLKIVACDRVIRRLQTARVRLVARIVYRL